MHSVYLTCAAVVRCCPDLLQSTVVSALQLEKDEMETKVCVYVCATDSLVHHNR